MLSELGQLKALKLLDLSHNELTGALSPSRGRPQAESDGKSGKATGLPALGPCVVLSKLVSHRAALWSEAEVPSSLRLICRRLTSGATNLLVAFRRRSACVGAWASSVSQRTSFLGPQAALSKCLLTNRVP